MAKRPRGMGVILAALLLIPSIGADEPAKPTTPREQYAVLTKEFKAATEAWQARSAGVGPQDPLIGVPRVGA